MPDLKKRPVVVGLYIVGTCSYFSTQSVKKNLLVKSYYPTMLLGLENLICEL